MGDTNADAHQFLFAVTGQTHQFLLTGRHRQATRSEVVRQQHLHLLDMASRHQ